MKHLICFLLAFVTFNGLNAQVQQSTRPQGDSNFSVWLTSTDTTKAKVFNGFSETLLLKLSESLHFADSLNKLWPKYDTIGGWHLVAASDTVRGWFLPVGFVYLYEVRVYKPEGWTSLKTGEVITQWINPKHFRWLDYNKQPFKFLVIDEIQRH